MDSNRSRAATLIGVAAAAGAFGAAAMISAATAPTAHADDFTDVINAIDADYSAAQAEFTAADTDFGGSDINDGLAAYFSGVDDDFVAAPNNLILGTVELAENDTVTGSLATEIPPESDFTSGLTFAETLIAEAQTYSTDAVSALSSGDYVSAAGAFYDVSLYDTAAVQVFLEGVVASF
jgi:hypothetical protein